MRVVTLLPAATEIVAAVWEPGVPDVEVAGFADLAAGTLHEQRQPTLVRQIPMADEILKDTFANHAFENFEIAAYKSLIAMAETVGHNQCIPALQQTLKEEQKTAQLIHDQIETITRRYMMLEQSGQRAKI